MGKYPDSYLLNRYSDWHYEKCNDKCLMSDADMTLIGLPDVYRLWFEVRDIDHKIVPVAVIDIKNMNSIDKEPTATAKAVYDWLLSKGIPVYIVKTTIEFKNFHVIRYSDQKSKIMSAAQYIEWIEKLKHS